MLSSVMKVAYRGVTRLGKHSATLCAVGAVVGLIISVALASEAGANATEIDENLEGKEKAVAYVKNYAGTGVATMITAALIIGSDRLHIRNELALGAVAAAWKSRYDQLDKKVQEVIPKEEYGQLQKDLMKDRMAESEKPQTIPPGYILIYLDCTDQYIVTTKEKLAWAVNALNRKLCEHGDATVNFFVSKLDDNAQTTRGDALGWSVDNENQFEVWEYNGCGWPHVNLMQSFMDSKDEAGAIIIYFDIPPETMYGDFFMHRTNYNG